MKYYSIDTAALIRELFDLKVHTKKLLNSIKELVDDLNCLAVYRARNEFILFFRTYKSGVFRIWETDNFIKARNEDVIITFQTGKAEDRFISVLEVIKINVNGNTNLIQVLDTGSLPRNDGYDIPYRFTKPEHLVAQIEREKRTHDWLIRIGKMESALIVAYVSLTKFSLTNYFDPNPQFINHLESMLS